MVTPHRRAKVKPRPHERGRGECGGPGSRRGAVDSICVVDVDLPEAAGNTLDTVVVTVVVLEPLHRPRVANPVTHLASIDDRAVPREPRRPTTPRREVTEIVCRGGGVGEASLPSQRVVDRQQQARPVAGRQRQVFERALASWQR